MKFAEALVTEMAAASVRPEQLAVDLNVSYWSVMAWRTGKTMPQRASEVALRERFPSLPPIDSEAA